MALEMNLKARKQYLFGAVIGMFSFGVYHMSIINEHNILIQNLRKVKIERNCYETVKNKEEYAGQYLFSVVDYNFDDKNSFKSFDDDFNTDNYCIDRVMRDEEWRMETEK